MISGNNVRCMLIDYLYFTLKLSGDCQLVNYIVSSSNSLLILTDLFFFFFTFESGLWKCASCPSIVCFLSWNEKVGKVPASQVELGAK